MRKFFLTAIGIIVLILNARADDAYPFSVGPYIALKAGVNAGNIQQGTKTGVAFYGTPDFGATVFLPFSKTSNVGAALDLGYSTYGVKYLPDSNAVDNNTFLAKFNYFTFAPALNANNFTVGFAFGIPLGESVANNSGSISKTYGTDSMGIIVEFRLGAMIPLLNSPTGRLDLLFQAGYMITGTYNNTSSYNPHPATVSLGLNYLFSLSKEQTP